MQDWEQRTSLLLGDESLMKLHNSHVLVVGVGGVGAYAVEMLVRSGVGHITIVDGDSVAISNLNRQLPALHSTVGEVKVNVMQKRMLDINPELDIEVRHEFITVDSVAELVTDKPFNFVVDAIDAIAPKVALIEYCMRNKVKIISSMGAGGRMDPTKIQYADISKTYNDGLAKVVRTRLRDKGLSKGLMTVWSPEVPRKESLTATNEIANKRTSYGTVSYLPSIFGCMLAAHVIRKLSAK